MTDLEWLRRLNEDKLLYNISVLEYFLSTCQIPPFSFNSSTVNKYSCPSKLTGIYCASHCPFYREGECGLHQISNLNNELAERFFMAVECREQLKYLLRRRKEIIDV